MFRKILSFFLLVCLFAGCARATTPTGGPLPTGIVPAGTPASSLPVSPGTSPVPPVAMLNPTMPAVPALRRLASYAPEPVSVVPAVITETVEPDFSNVVSSFLLTDTQQERLVQNGFIVSPSGEKEFYVLYKQARANGEPVFVTSDSLLHVYYMLSDKVLRNLEKEEFTQLLKRLNARMLHNAAEQYQALRGTSLEEEARLNVAYFAVAGRLLDPGIMIPDYVGDTARAELDLIDQHSGPQPSPVFPGQKEDYAQYIPCGHYRMSPELEAYYQSMLWYGRMTFRILKPDDPTGRAETSRALLVVQALASDPEAVQLWSAVYEPVTFFAGRSDDLLYSEYGPLVNQVYGGLPTPAGLIDEARLTQFMQEAQKLHPPDVLGLAAAVGQGKEGTATGFRFLGQRFLPDSYLFAQLVDGQVPGRQLPKGLDLLAALGSQRAYSILGQEGDAAYQNYVQNMNNMRQKLAGLNQDDWTQSFHGSWLYSFLPLLARSGVGYPAFMQNDAWLEKNMNTVLGSWAELRHDTILYAKQVPAEGGGGGKGSPPEPVPPKGYVEPVPEFYARVAALAQMTADGLQQRGLTGGAGGSSHLSLALRSLQQLKDLSLALKAMAEKELSNQPLSDDEYARIQNYGSELEQLTFAASDEYQGTGETASGEEPQAAFAATLATNSNQVLVEALGRISAIYVIAPIEGELVVVKGGVYSYYEFDWPVDDGMTDAKWQQMLDEGRAPTLPSWTALYRVEETEDLVLREAIWHFNQQYTAAVWAPDPGLLDAVATGEALEGNKAYIQTNLIDEGRYEANWLLHFEIASFYYDDPELAFVITLETWAAAQYQMASIPTDPGMLVAQRAEYTVPVVYRIALVDGVWKVAQVQTRGVPTPWEEITQ